ncbi:MAG: helix-turn-helix domain-containing protein [Pseudomonadota bacterium]
MAHTELDLRERRTIEDMLNARVPVSKIAAEIGRHRSTIYPEIKCDRISHHCRFWFCRPNPASLRRAAMPGWQ